MTTVAVEGITVAMVTPVQLTQCPARHRHRRIRHPLPHRSSGDDPTNAVEESSAYRLSRHQRKHKRKHQRSKARRHQSNRPRNVAEVSHADKAGNATSKPRRLRLCRNLFRRPRRLHQSSAGDRSSVVEPSQVAPRQHRLDCRTHAVSRSAVRHPLLQSRESGYRPTRRETRNPSQSSRNRKTRKKTMMKKRMPTKKTKRKTANRRSSTGIGCAHQICVCPRTDAYLSVGYNQFAFTNATTGEANCKSA